MEAKIFEIKRFAVHDGDGIRTTVFFKGCPLRCVWCHNPEGIDFKPQLAYYANKCLSCGECVSACPRNAHEIKDGLHIFKREYCIACGGCEGVCPSGALKLYGWETSLRELLDVLLEDKDFYDSSGGGVTLSGGECLMQADFCAELLCELKKMKIHTSVDTCGFVAQAAFDKVMPYTDIFLYDIKAFDEEMHIRFTGQSNKLILQNLKYIDRCGASTEVRIPYVPKYNANQIEKIGEFLSSLKYLTKVRVLPYHNYAGSKYEALGVENTLPDILPNLQETESAARKLQGFGINTV